MTNDYEPPQAIRLTDSDRAFGTCSSGSTPNGVQSCVTGGQVARGYRENGFAGVCVTGKSAGSGCFAGV